MKNRVINLAAVEEVAAALKEIKDQVVFVGGSVISLYVDEILDDEIRPTKDIDITVKLLNYGHWEKLQTRLAELGIYPDPEGKHICGYKYKDIPIDVMSMDEGPLGPSNPWYNKGLDQLQIVNVGEQVIRIFSAPVYLATKFEAFNSRGRDYRTSHDFEDIIYVLENREIITHEVEKCPTDVRDFIRSELSKVMQSPYSEEILSAHLPPFSIEEHYPLLIEKIYHILEL